MDLKQYTQDAIRTESLIDNVETNKDFLVAAMEMFMASGTLLDYLKKQIFYGKPINDQQINQQLSRMYGALDLMRKVESDPYRFLNFQPVAEITDTRAFHAIIGIATEATELVEAQYKQLQTGAMDGVNVLEEIGDISWYTAILMDTFDGDWAGVLNTNIEKLRARYPEKFTSENAIERDLNKERQILEK